MSQPSCDILVVGAGPAGAAAARAAARRGVSVLLVEQKSRIGLPVQCAEYIPAMLLGQLNLGRDFVAQSVKGMKTYRPGGSETFTRAPGFVIHRDRFDQTLAQAAAAEGVEVMLSTRVRERLASGAVVLQPKNGEPLQVHPKLVIGADGPRSTVGRWVGAVNENLLPGVQLTLPLTQPLDHTEVYFQPNIYAGYGWLFPKGDVANVGLGLRHRRHSATRVRRILDDFVAELKDQGKIAGPPVAAAAGWIPAEPVRQAVYGSVALVGDAAGHTHPITGAGIFAAVTGGRIAGKWAASAVRQADMALLGRYEYEWQDLMGDTLGRAYERRQYMESHWDDFDATVQKCWVAFRAYYE